MFPRLRTTLLVCTLLIARATAEGTDSPQADSPRDPLQVHVDRAIDISSKRFLTIDHHSPWQILHGLLARRQAFVIKRNDKLVRAIDWVSNGASYQGQALFEVTPHGGRAKPYTQPYEFEGHPNQFLAILSMSQLPPQHRFQAGESSVTISDLLKHAQATVNNREEITWTLWALSHYLPPETRWMNAEGEPWSIERLVQIQTGESSDEAACGGTHGLFALTSARNAYRRAHAGQLRGAWLEADQKIQRHLEEAKLYQNEDGTFSASYFVGPHQSHDFSERVETSGHTLEWLVLAVPREQLRSSWVRRGVAAMASDLTRHADESIQCGPLYHALHGLVIYRERTRQSPPRPPRPRLSRAPKK